MSKLTPQVALMIGDLIRVAYPDIQIPGVQWWCGDLDRGKWQSSLTTRTKHLFLSEICHTEDEALEYLCSFLTQAAKLLCEECQQHIERPVLCRVLKLGSVVSVCHACCEEKYEGNSIFHDAESGLWRPVSSKPSTRCLTCNKSFTEAEIEGANCCPNCHSKSIPANPDFDVVVKMNWHELRILTNWASFWAQRFDPTQEVDRNAKASLKAILDRIRAQFPELSLRMPLTLMDEAQQISNETGSKVTIAQGGMTEKITPKKPN